MAYYQEDEEFEAALVRDRTHASWAFANLATPGISPEHDVRLQPAAVTGIMQPKTNSMVNVIYEMTYDPNDVSSHCHV